MEVGLFLDIEGAFNCTSVDAIQGAMIRHGVGDTTIRWVKNMLTSRLLTVDRGEGTPKVAVECGCPQGGVLSPLLRCPVVNNFIERLNGKGI